MEYDPFGQGLSLGPCLDLECSECGGSPENHAPECDYGHLERLNERNTFLSCPKCHEQEVGVNDQDYFECRSCHVQFSTSPTAEGVTTEESVLLDHKRSEDYHVLVLEAKGEGKFPLDEAAEEVGRRLKEKEGG